MTKKRLDLVVLEQNPQFSRTYIQSIIMQGKIAVDGKVMTKPGVLISPDVTIVISAHEPKYVSRAGFKLEKALDHFNLDVTGLVVLDAGISTGGFTDCLLQRGVKRVYGVDVGYGQVHEKVSSNERVVIMERTNLRNLSSLPELVDLVTLDLSFISVLKVIPAVIPLLKPDGKIIILIKPQFEAERKHVSRGGIVRDPRVHTQVVKDITQGMKDFGFVTKGVIESPLEGADGNKEFLALFSRKE